MDLPRPSYGFYLASKNMRNRRDKRKKEAMIRDGSNAVLHAVSVKYELGGGATVAATFTTNTSFHYHPRKYGLEAVLSFAGIPYKPKGVDSLTPTLPSTYARIFNSDTGGAGTILHAVSVRYETSGDATIATTFLTSDGHFVHTDINAAQKQQKTTENAEREPAEQKHPHKLDVEGKMAQLIEKADALKGLVEKQSAQLNETTAQLLERIKSVEI